MNGRSELIWREDIITDNDQLGKHCVIALYPQHHHQLRYIILTSSSFLLPYFHRIVIAESISYGTVLLRLRQVLCCVQLLSSEGSRL